MSIPCLNETAVIIIIASFLVVAGGFLNAAGGELWVMIATWRRKRSMR